MALIDQVRQVLDRLAPLGWGELLAQHGLDVGAADFAAELARPLAVKRQVQGFEDFSLDGTRAIEPGFPARSLLYHALASPRVEEGPGVPRLEDFPTLAEIGVVEDYVFAAAGASLDDLRERAGGAPLAVVVFAYEYRPASHTCHKRHADLVFARTGVSRVGDTAPLYRARFRGFVPYVDENAHAFRVCPARYGAFLAVRQRGSSENFCPMRFLAPRAEGTLNADDEGEPGDPTREFWMPIHKLFPGNECLRGVDALEVELDARHLNEKLRRIHVAFSEGILDGIGVHKGGWKAPDIDNPPFRFEDGLAEWSTDAAHGRGLLVPVPHPITEPARYKGKLLSFNVPKNEPFASSLELRTAAGGGPRPVPEYVHIRTRVLPDGTTEDLNDRPNVAQVVAAGGYRALHYVDYTADGAITAKCSLLDDAGAQVTGPVAAYSLVTAPDFFFQADQREMTEWTESLPTPLRNEVWQVPPDTLSDQRLAANVQFPNSPFSPDDVTCTAIVSLFGQVSPQQTNARPHDAARHSHMPDDSAGVFAPGWDISRDALPDGRPHLAAYGLGSPFPEDAKLYAALSTFWPAAAPDSTRTFAEVPRVTASPLTDEEIGRTGSLPWDGVPGPRDVTAGGVKFAEYASFAHVDYVLNALAGRFSLRVTAHITPEEYQRRVLAMVLTYRTLEHVTGMGRENFAVLSFRHTTPGETELVQAQAQAGTALPGRAYRFETFRRGALSPAKDPRKRRMRIVDPCTLFVDPEHRRVLISRAGDPFVEQAFGPF